MSTCVEQCGEISSVHRRQSSKVILKPGNHISPSNRVLAIKLRIILLLKMYKVEAKTESSKIFYFNMKLFHCNSKKEINPNLMFMIVKTRHQLSEKNLCLHASNFLLPKVKLQICHVKYQYNLKHSSSRSFPFDVRLSHVTTLHCHTTLLRCTELGINL